MTRTNLVNKAPSRFRTAKWLESNGYAPQVFLFRNLERGQVVYSQLSIVGQRQINVLFKRPNRENRKPSTRRDLWKCMCVVDLGNYVDAVQLYQNLVRLRYMRDVLYAKENDKLRLKNEWGNVWNSGLFRPTFTQEAVADLRESLLKLDSSSKDVDQNLLDATIYWEDAWRMGDKEKYWTPVLPNVHHELMERTFNTSREESALLKELCLKSLESMKEQSEATN